MRFACDVMLGKLAKYLRILGFDTLYLRNLKALERFAAEDDPRYFVTRRRRPMGYGRTIRLAELKSTIRDAIDLHNVLSRCISCNMLLKDVEKDSIEHRVPEFVFHTYQSFKSCPSCGRVYWQGTHTTHMSRLIAEMTG
jgi:uncharacterized protein with PIN domain